VGGWLECVILCAFTVSLAAQTPDVSASRPFSALSAADRVELQQLIARYSHALDHAPPDGLAFAELFTGDGTLVTATETFTGHPALAAYASRYRAANGGARNLSTNVLIEAVPGGASGKVYVVAVRSDPAGPGSIIAGGHFEDRYVRTAQGWRFLRRQFFASRLR
jgi:hypothetical protein